ncbi:MAG: hypothetical protein ACREOF_18890 [Gemmatimonadales bacterium]
MHVRLSRGAGSAALAALLGLGPAALEAWRLSDAAKAGFREIWHASVADRRERVGCLGGIIAMDTVHVDSVRLLPDGESDSLTAGAEVSLSQCAAPGWIGTVHTHVRSTDDDVPVARFSPGDRAVMSAWSKRYARAGAFCVLYSAKGAHCEVWPSRARPRVVRPGG